MRAIRSSAILAFTFFLSFPCGDSFAQKMYWTDSFTGKVRRANLDGTSVEDLFVGQVSGNFGPSGITLDLVAGKIYWTDNLVDVIRRSNLDGSNVEDLVTTGLLLPAGIALDLAAGKMYWVDARTFGVPDGVIQRANLNGSGVETLVFDLTSPSGLELDLVSGHMYWVVESDGVLQKAALDGSDITTLVVGQISPIDIALDLTFGKMYWTDSGSPDVIKRANLDGSEIETLISNAANQFLESTLGLALDLEFGKIYWTVATDITGVIRRANLDGTDMEDMVDVGRVPRELALDTGACLSDAACGDANVCTDAICVQGLCVFEINTAPCDDGNICTSGDICFGGVCEGIPNSNPCSDGNQCTDDVCAGGQCVGTPNTKPCDDQNLCTDDDTCSGGECVGTPNTAPCDDGNFCTDDVCAGGVCVAVPNDDPCDDENLCTDDDTCSGGECVGTPNTAPCDDGNFCTDDVCAGGVCVSVPTNDPCDDENSCTTDDVCAHGLCRGTPIPGECPIFRVWVREVYDADLIPKCGVICPTQDLPEGIAEPGDFIDIEFTVEGWGSIDPGGLRIGVFQCSLETSTFSLGHTRPGFRVADLPCSTNEDCLCAYSSVPGEFNDCADFTAINPGSCTCAASACNTVAQTCDVESSIYIARDRFDYLFAPVEAISVVVARRPPEFAWAAVDFRGVGIAEFDPVLQREPPYYMGTLVVQVADNVAGTYVIDLLQDLNHTFLTQPSAARFPGPAIVPLTITLADFVTDDDGDGVPNAADNCPLTPNPGQSDQDGEGIGDACDNCPAVANVGQADTDGDGTGDACEGACCLDDGRCLPQDVENCLSTGGTPGPDGANCEGDVDADGIVDACDRCPGVDDAVFASECEGAIPTTSQWGVVVLALLLLAGGKIYFNGRRLNANEGRR